MSASRLSPEGLAVPVVPYTDVVEAREWLCQAFGFEPLEITNGPDGTPIFAQVVHGKSLILLSRSEGRAAEHRADERCYLIVDDIDAHFSRAIDSGAMVIAPIEESAQGRSYSCRDFAGHAWAFGTFDPRHDTPAAPKMRVSPWVQGAVATTVGVALLAGSAFAGAVFFSNAWPEIETAFIDASGARAQRDQAYEQSLKTLRQKEVMKADLIAEKTARGVAEANEKAINKELLRVKSAQAKVDTELTKVRQALAKEREAHDEAAKAARDYKTKAGKLERLLASTDRTAQKKLENLQLKLNTYKNLENSIQETNAALKEERVGRDEDKKSLRALQTGLAKARDALRQATTDLEAARASLEAEKSRRRVAEGSLKAAIAALRERKTQATPVVRTKEPPAPKPISRSDIDAAGVALP